MRISHAFFVTLSASLLTHTAFAQSSTIENRVDVMEKKLDALIELMQRKNPAASGNASESEMPQDEYYPGLYLDVWAPSSSSIQNQGPIYDIPGVPTASITVPPSSPLKFTEFLRHSETQKYSSSPIVGVRFSGFIRIEKEGAFTFRNEIGGDFGYDSACRSSFSINGKKVTSALKKGSVADDSPASDQAEVTLIPGIYKYSYFTICAKGLRYIDYNAVSSDLQMAIPGGRQLRNIPNNILLIGQDE